MLVHRGLVDAQLVLDPGLDSEHIIYTEVHRFLTIKNQQYFRPTINPKLIISLWCGMVFIFFLWRFSVFALPELESWTVLVAAFKKNN